MHDVSTSSFSSSRRLIVGAGVIGQAAAEELQKLGQEVVLASRRALQQRSGLPHLRLDARDAQALKAAAQGASHIYLTLGLAYRARVWERDWPCVMQAAIDAALVSGARLVWFDNLYAYGPLPLQLPMREDHPVDPPSRKGRVRAGLLDMLQRAGEQQGLRWVVARSADFYGPGAHLSLLYVSGLARQLRGRPAWWLGDPDRLHSFTYTIDAAQAMVRLALDEDTGEQAWHLPTTEPALTPRQLLAHSARLLEAPQQVQRLSVPLIRALGLGVPMLREVGEMLYQNQQDYVFACDKFMARYPDFAVTSYADGLQATLRFFQQTCSAS